MTSTPKQHEFEVVIPAISQKYDVVRAAHSRIRQRVHDILIDELTGALNDIVVLPPGEGFQADEVESDGTAQEGVMRFPCNGLTVLHVYDADAQDLIPTFWARDAKSRVLNRFTTQVGWP